MHFGKPLVAAAAISMAATVAGPARAQETGLEASLRVLQRVATQYTILLTRMFVDMTYDSIAVEGGTNDLIVTGLRLYPELDWDQDGRCEIAVDRAVIAELEQLRHAAHHPRAQRPFAAARLLPARDRRRDGGLWL